MYAIIEDSGTQIKVSEGDVIKVALRDLPEESEQVPEITFDRVLMVGGEGEPKIGAPVLDGAKVTAELLERGRTPRVEVVKFRRRKGYKRHKSHRQDYLSVKITSIKS